MVEESECSNSVPLVETSTSEDDTGDGSQPDTSATDAAIQVIQS